MQNFDRLFRPKSIAVIGGGTWCENVIKSLQSMSYKGAIFSVHPSKENIAGITCVKSVADLPISPDACFVGVNRNVSIDVVRALSHKKAGGVVAFASGFSEASAEDSTAKDLQMKLVDAAGNMPILGPNCYGFINYLDGSLLWPDQHGGKRVERGVAIIAQSSNIAINLTMQKRGLPIGYMVTVGNQAQIGLSQIAAHLLNDDRVTAIGLYVEGIDDLAAFQEMAAIAFRLGKPIVALKVGKSEHSQRATISHTASLAGSDAGAKAMFRHLGIAQVESLPQLIEALKIAHIYGKLNSNEIASMSCSGGEASIVADSAANLDLMFSTLAEDQNIKLAGALGPLVALSNPLDYNTYIWGRPEKMTDVFTAMLTPNLGIGFVVLDLPRDDRCDPAAWLPVIDCLDIAHKKTGVPAAVLSSFPETLPESIADLIMSKGLVALSGIDDALCAIEVMATINEARSPIKIAHRNVVERTEIVDEFSAKRMLEEQGLNIPSSIKFGTAKAIMRDPIDLNYPLVLKGLGIAHKSEMNAVHLGISNEDELVQKANSFNAEGYLVEEMVLGAIAELLIGIVLDPAHGFVLTIAAGGVQTEILKDSVSLSVPASEDHIFAAIKSLNCYPLLDGFRGSPKADMGAIIEAIMTLQSMVTDCDSEIYEIEINPLICTKSDAIAADVLMKIGVKS